MTYVYILRSIAVPSQIYVGLTKDLRRRLAEHSNGGSRHTEKYRPWKIETYIAFEDEFLAERFEEYLKHGSGHAFMKSHLIR